MWRLRGIARAAGPRGLAASLVISAPLPWRDSRDVHCQTSKSFVRSMATPLDIRLGLTKPQDVAHKLRWGIIGCGPISADWCKSLKDVPGAELKSCAARDVQKAKQFAEEHGISKASASYKELVEDPEVDIVYIGTITPLHKEQTLMAIAAGKHVLCEKPIATSLTDAEEMYAAAEAKGVALIEGLWTRYFPAVEHARAAVELGVIGEVQMVQVDFPEICYALQYAPLFFGSTEATEVASAGGPAGAGAVLRYGNQGAAVLSFPSWRCEMPEVCEVIGTKGRITLDDWGAHPSRVTIRLTTEQCWEEAQGHTATAQNGVRPHTEQVTYPVPEPAGLPAAGWNYVNQHGFVYQAEAIHRCLAAGLKECPQFTKAESLRIQRLLDEIEKGITEPCR